MLKRSETPNLTVRFAHSCDEIRAAQRLRYRVFVEELGAKPAGANHKLRIEADELDTVAKHLCVFDQNLQDVDPENAVVGVYRLLSEADARDAGGFYSSAEFDLSNIEALHGRKLELGRSCVRADYRGGYVLAALWRGIGEFVQNHQIDYLFGTASYCGVKTSGREDSLSFVMQKYLAPPHLRTKVKADAALDFTYRPLDHIRPLNAMRTTPTLIKSYLRLGGVVGEGAYVDHDFNTIDLFMLVEARALFAKIRSSYA